jgi:hypothetical protein
MAQPFLEAGKHRPLVAGLDVDDAVGSQPGLRERGREEVEAGSGTRAPCPWCAPPRPATKRAAAAPSTAPFPPPRHLVQRAEREASVGKPFV